MMALAIASTAAGCGAHAPLTAQEIELANMWPSHVIPKSSPAQMITAFRKACLAPDPESARASLRARDYVRAPSGAGIEKYLVDDTKPMVMLTPKPDSFGCAVGAEARTGQTNRVADFVAETFPKARSVDPAAAGGEAESLWRLEDGSGEVLYTMRTGSSVDAPGFIFGVYRP